MPKHLDSTSMLPDEIDASVNANGIVQCMRMLADEARELGLCQTSLSLQDVIILCQAESSHPKSADAVQAPGLRSDAGRKRGDGELSHDTHDTTVH